MGFKLMMFASVEQVPISGQMLQGAPLLQDARTGSVFGIPSIANSDGLVMVTLNFLSNHGVERPSHTVPIMRN